MKFEVKEEKAKFIKWSEGMELAVVFKAIVPTLHGEAISGIDVDTKEPVLVPLTATLNKIKNEFVEKGDIIAFKCKGTRKSKYGRFSYYDIAFSIYKKDKDFKLEDVLGGSDIPF